MKSPEEYRLIINEQKTTFNNLLDEFFSYFPFYFRLPINFFRGLINKGFYDPIYFLYCYNILLIS